MQGYRAIERYNFNKRRSHHKLKLFAKIDLEQFAITAVYETLKRYNLFFYLEQPMKYPQDSI